MPPLWNDVRFLVGDAQQVEQMPTLAPFAVFDPRCIDFLDALSRKLLACPDIRRFPDLLTFAFWCRRRSLLEQHQETVGIRMGKGMVFHIAPSNIDSLFAYSLAAGLLAGNANVVRLSSRNLELPESAARICTFLNALLEEDFSELRPYIACVQYGHTSAVTDHVSALCDVRMIWGGDETIRIIRKSPLQPRATELTFANRFSLCIIQSAAWLETDAKAALARSFYTDTYLNDQNACTAPQLLVWLGEDDAQIDTARENFWGHLGELVQRDYPVNGAQSVAKLEAFCLLAANHPEVRLIMDDARMMRIETPELYSDLMDFRPGGGFFFEAKARDLYGLLPIVTGKCQTIISYGVTREAFESFLKTARPKGIDRIAAFGHSMDFSLVWDGYDLLSHLSNVRSLFLHNTHTVA